MIRLPPRLSSPSRAFAAGLRAQLAPQTPYAAWRTELALAAAPPEVAAAYRAGATSNPAMPMPATGALLAAVVRQMAGTSVELGRDSAGISCTASGQAWQNEGALGGANS